MSNSKQHQLTQWLAQKLHAIHKRGQLIQDKIEARMKEVERECKNVCCPALGQNCSETEVLKVAMTLDSLLDNFGLLLLKIDTTLHDGDSTLGGHQPASCFEHSTSEFQQRLKNMKEATRAKAEAEWRRGSTFFTTLQSAPARARPATRDALSKQSPQSLLVALCRRFHTGQDKVIFNEVLVNNGQLNADKTTFVAADSGRYLFNFCATKETTQIFSFPGIASESSSLFGVRASTATSSSSKCANFVLVCNGVQVKPSFGAVDKQHDFSMCKALTLRRGDVVSVHWRHSLAVPQRDSGCSCHAPAAGTIQICFTCMFTVCKLE